MIRQCHFHMDEDITGASLSDGAHEFTCRRAGHPGDAPWTWLESPAPPDPVGLGGLAEELALETVLPAVVSSLGSGWFEYGLIERAYAELDPKGFARMVERWGHTALSRKQYSVSAYLASCLGRLSRSAAVAYHAGVGTGRWSYNADISWWAAMPAPDWEERTSWAEATGDDGSGPDLCLAYVAG